MTTQDTKAIVLRMVERGMIEGDVDAAIATYDPDFIYHNPVLKVLPPHRHTTDVVRQLIGATREAFPDMRYVIDTVVAEGDEAAVLYTWSGTNTEPLAGLPATGRRVTATGAILCRVADGRIVEQWDIDDRLDVMQQLGLLPAAAPAS